jgi:hypothetical protein
MKRCTYCGKEYPDEAEVCAIDQVPLQEVPHWPPGTTLRQQLVAMKLSDDFDAAARRRDRKQMYSILIHIGMKEKPAAFVIGSTLVQSGKGNRPLVTRGSPVVWILAALTMLGLSIYGFPFMFDEIKSGWAYSPAVVFGDGAKVYHSTSPVAYWFSVALPMAGFVAMPIISIFVLCGVVIDHKRKSAAAAKEKGQADA